MKEYADWMRGTVLPSARTDTRLPPELYAFQLKQVGMDITPQELIQRAELEFMETRATMQQLAPLVATRQPQADQRGRSEQDRVVGDEYGRRDEAMRRFGRGVEREKKGSVDGFDCLHETLSVGGECQ